MSTRNILIDAQGQPDDLLRTQIDFEIFLDLCPAALKSAHSKA